MHPTSQRILSQICEPPCTGASQPAPAGLPMTIAQIVRPAPAALVAEPIEQPGAADTLLPPPVA